MILLTHAAFSQTYPFQDAELKEDERIRNLISLLTRDEKVNCLSPMISIPRLNVKGSRVVEGWHGFQVRYCDVYPWDLTKTLKENKQ
jgi:hypothetical protein